MYFYDNNLFDCIANLTNEIEQHKNKSLARIKDYITATKDILQSVDRDIRRCDGAVALRGIIFISDKFFYFIF